MTKLLLHHQNLVAYLLFSSSPLATYRMLMFAPLIVALPV